MSCCFRQKCSQNAYRSLPSWYQIADWQLLSGEDGGESSWRPGHFLKSLGDQSRAKNGLKIELTFISWTETQLILDDNVVIWLWNGFYYLVKLVCQVVMEVICPLVAKEINLCSFNITVVLQMRRSWFVDFFPSPAVQYVIESWSTSAIWIGMRSKLMKRLTKVQKKKCCLTYKHKWS